MNTEKQCAADNDNNINHFRSSFWITVFLIFSLFAGLLVCQLIKFNYNSFSPIHEDQYVIGDDKLMHNLDSVTVDKGYLSIVGWAADVTQNIDIINCGVVLKDETSGVYYEIKTEYQNRQGISQALGTDKSIDDCGFIAKTSLSHLNTNSIYEICVLYLHDDNNLLYHTGEKINAQGELIGE